MKKIFSSTGRMNSDWTEQIVESSQIKTASIKVQAGSVSCPKAGKVISTLNCELCKHCSGSNVKVASSEEFIHCGYKYDTQEKSNIDSMDKFVTVASAKSTEEISEEDFRMPLFTKSDKSELFEDTDILSEKKVVSSGNDVSSKLATGPKGYVPEWNNSIFNSDALDSFAEKELAKEAKISEAKATAHAEKLAKKAEWDKDVASDLKEIGYIPDNGIKSIAHESGVHTEDVADHKFSIFDNIDDKLANIPDRTEGEMLKAQSDERTEKIARKVEKDNSWEQVKKGSSTSTIMDSFIDKLLSDKEK
jgi:hypothetical protein